MSNTIIRPKDRNEWLKHREEGIGSSEVATIIGLNPWETPYQLWRRKRGLDTPKEENFAMRAGHYLEDAVSLFWHDETGRDIIKSSAGDWLIVNKERPYLRVSPDRTYWLEGMTRNNSNKGILECKTTQMSVDPDDIPQHWFCQIQYQLGVAELQHGSLAWLSQGREFGYKDVHLVPDFFEEFLVPEVERFWIDNVLGGLEPEAQSIEDVLTKYNRHTEGKIIEVDEAIYVSVNELKAVRDEIAQLDERKEELEKKIKMAFGSAEGISFQGRTLATWKAPRPSEKFDAAKYQDEHPDLCKPYMKTVQGGRRFLLKK